MAKKAAAREPETADMDIDSTPAELFGVPAAPVEREPEPEVDATEAKVDATEAEASDENEAEVVETDTENPEPAQPEAEAKPDEDQVIEVNGIKRTKEEWNKFLSDAETWRNQAGHFNQKYTEALEQLRATESARMAALVPEPQQPAPTVDGWFESMQPNVKELVKQGFLDEEDAEINPKLCAGYAQLAADRQALSRWVAERAEPAIRAIASLGIRDQELNERREVEAFHQELNNRIDRVEKQGTVFSALGNQETRQGFMTYLSRVNPEVRTLMGDQGEEMLADLFVAFSKKVLLDSASAAQAQSSPATTTKTRRVAGGEAGSPVTRAKENPNADIVSLFAKDARG